MMVFQDLQVTPLEVTKSWTAINQRTPCSTYNTCLRDPCIETSEDECIWMNREGEKGKGQRCMLQTQSEAHYSTSRLISRDGVGLQHIHSVAPRNRGVELTCCLSSQHTLHLNSVTSAEIEHKGVVAVVKKCHYQAVNKATKPTAPHLPRTPRGPRRCSSSRRVSLRRTHAASLRTRGTETFLPERQVHIG